MTLIAAIFHPDKPMMCITDAALSGGSPLDASGFPVQQDASDDFFGKPQATNATISGTHQKSALFGKHMLLWAGSYLVAFSVVKFLKQQALILNHRNCRALLEQEFGQELHKVSLIYGYAETTAHVIEVNCETTRRGKNLIIYSGSGSYRFLEEFDAEMLSKPRDSPFQEVSSRLGYLYFKEQFDENAYYHNIGFSYEVIGLFDQGWQRMPYCAVMYGHSAESFGVRKVISTHYFTNVLCIAVNLYENSPTQHIDDWVFLNPSPKHKSTTWYAVPGFEHRKPEIEELFKAVIDGNDYYSTVPRFSISVLEGTEDASTSDTKLLASYSNIPATSAYFLSEKGFAVIRRAFHMREIEGDYLGRVFVPPEDKRQFYEDQLKEQMAGIGFDFAALFQRSRE